jgi:4-alpha-glucanotransferase
MQVPQPISGAERLADAKRRLGVDRLLLQIHDASFPSDPDEDIGRGSPYSRAADRLFSFAAELGFDGIQLGPQGMTGREQPSPYEGTLFSRNPLNLPLGKLAAAGRLSEEWLAESRRRIQAAGHPPPLKLIEGVFDDAVRQMIARATPDDRRAARAFLETHERWLIPDALYAPLCREHGSSWWGTWNAASQGEFDQRLFAPPPGNEDQAEARLAELRRRYAQEIEDYAFIQWLLAEEHRRLRERLARLGLTLFADLQVGLAPQDMWSRQSVFLPQYRLGAPPSRTNPDGQPWGFAVLDPEQYGTRWNPGPVLEFVADRLDRVLDECDGLRIDHPHGWIDPWVYRADDPDPSHAVQNGARLFSTPDDPEHRLLRKWAIARGDQIDLRQPPYADRRVRELSDIQVDDYAILVAKIIERLEAHGRPRTALACEVLSTLPYPMQRVLERFGLGRFRVTSKLNLHDPGDVYRIEHARPEDWIMLGTHDTASIWQYADDWFRAGAAPQWAAYLAPLLPRGTVAPARHPGEIVQPLFAAMLASRARNVAVFFPDLFGMTERYNRPGVACEQNWRLRIPNDFERLYEERRRAGLALDVPQCLAMALSASP